MNTRRRTYIGGWEDMAIIGTWIASGIKRSNGSVTSADSLTASKRVDLSEYSASSNEIIAIVQGYAKGEVRWYENGKWVKNEVNMDTVSNGRKSIMAYLCESESISGFNSGGSIHDSDYPTPSSEINVSRSSDGRYIDILVSSSVGSAGNSGEHTLEYDVRITIIDAGKGNVISNI